jgi:outer membrane biogenesis lipoprotein LolB
MIHVACVVSWIRPRLLSAPAACAVTTQKLVPSMTWIPAFAGMTNLRERAFSVIPAQAGIQVQWPFQGLRRLFFKKSPWVLLIVCALLGACGPKPPPAGYDEPDRVSVVWSLFQASFVQDCHPEDFSLRASVNFSAPDRHSRFIVSMWGRTDFPIRLDVQAGVGAMLAHWREDREAWLGYLPASREAYVADTAQEGAWTTGLFMPVRLDALAQLLLGCWQTLIPLEYEAVRLAGDTLEFHVTGHSTPLTLVLAFDGRPVSVRGPEHGGWTVSVDQWESDPPSRPRRISLIQGDQSAMIRVQRLETSVDPWRDEDLRLDVPPGSTVWTVPN